MPAARRKRREAPASTSPSVEELQQELESLRKKLERAEANKARAVTRETSRLRKENEMLEAQLTRLVQEMGQLRFVVDRVPQLERELRVKDQQIADAEAEAERIREALNSGRPTARAAAAASQAARLFSSGR